MAEKKIRLLRGSRVVKEVEFLASLSPLEIHRLSVVLMFEHFERNATRIWAALPQAPA